ncbi:hypothetical protein PR003_g29009 [Phytophthora rubi]|uniref:Uncharacterized protein n=1 Tax=Phytophthora rubi TaxID=129364 RepID=A0A6A4BV51_9STRA|nr:hypothetical protein PR002_g23397 [Phytophthora rubi]KAE9276623.1 hypothetical protein PR003_g29009 [Phytophthora rubi]
MWGHLHFYRRNRECYTALLLLLLHRTGNVSANLPARELGRATTGSCCTAVVAPV